MLSTDFTKAAAADKCRALKSFIMTGAGAEWRILWETEDDTCLTYVVKKFGKGGRTQVITVETDGTVRASHQYLGEEFPQYKLFSGLKAAVAWTER
jgi:hypothetical protein